MAVAQGKRFYAKRPSSFSCDGAAGMKYFKTVAVMILSGLALTHGQHLQLFNCGDICTFGSSGTCINEFDFCLGVSSVTLECPPGFAVCTNISRTHEPTAVPTELPSDAPMQQVRSTTVSTYIVGTTQSATTQNFAPSDSPTPIPTSSPTVAPSLSPTSVPTDEPSAFPTQDPTTMSPTIVPTFIPTMLPSVSPTATRIRVDCSACVATSSGNCRNTFGFCLSVASLAACPPGFDHCYVGDVPLETLSPTSEPTDFPTISPSDHPTNVPTSAPQNSPSDAPSLTPTQIPSTTPSSLPTLTPTDLPTAAPSLEPSAAPTMDPTAIPTRTPVDTPTVAPTAPPTTIPTATPTSALDCTSCFATSRGQCKNGLDFCIAFLSGSTRCPPGFRSCSESTMSPTEHPTPVPSSIPTPIPTAVPTTEPTRLPTTTPTSAPSAAPSIRFVPEPTLSPTSPPTRPETLRPTAAPSTPPPTGTPSVGSVSTTTAPATLVPTGTPTATPTQPAPPTSPNDCLGCFATSAGPCKNAFGFCIQYLGDDICPQGFVECARSEAPTEASVITAPPTHAPTHVPTVVPSTTPSASPSATPTAAPSHFPTLFPTATPTTAPTATPTGFPTQPPETTSPTRVPIGSPTAQPSDAPSMAPTAAPSSAPSTMPTAVPSRAVTASPTQVPTAHSDCVDCFASSRGQCQNAFQFCFPFIDGTTLCPPGFTQCTATGTVPTMALTDAPTSTSPTGTRTQSPTAMDSATSASPLVCPSNCGRVTSGGGTCEVVQGEVKCTSCNDGRVLHLGRCQSTLYCRGNRVRNAALLDERCRCSINHCFYCDITADGETCRKCRDGYYRLNETCHESCPATMASSGISLFGRECFPPFTCVSNRARIGGETVTCKCPLRDVRDSPLGNCHNCSFEVGGYGGICNKCRNSKFLYNHQCHDDCSVAPSTFVAYDIGSYGRRCRNPFTCTDTRDEQGEKCKCPVSIGGGRCGVCDWGMDATTGTTTAVCTQCKSNRFLLDGACVARCPTGYEGVIPVVRGARGRVCVPLP
eukprot:m.1638089 g.1638089  ORF g.1638089 m.1638089 type:complete len:1036 (+) comp26821_c0_seq1:219-3326(+)